MRLHQQKIDAHKTVKANAANVTDYCTWCFKHKGKKFNNHTEATCNNKARANGGGERANGGGEMASSESRGEVEGTEQRNTQPVSPTPIARFLARMQPVTPLQRSQLCHVHGAALGASVQIVAVALMKKK